MDPKRFALRVKLYKMETQAVFIQAILSEILNKSGKKTTMVKGYCTSGGESCFHVWLEDDTGEIIDITKFLFPQYQDVSLTKEDVPGAMKDQFTVDLFELYNSDKADFWKKAPRKLLDFRTKCKQFKCK